MHPEPTSLDEPMRDAVDLEWAAVCHGRRV
jgi:hypothetical protein